MKAAALFFLCLLPLCLLTGCGGGQEIESCLFVLSMAVDPAPEGNVTVTVKALSGTQEAGGGGSALFDTPEKQNGTETEAETETEKEATEAGYIVLSATAGSCLRALSLLSATTPRTVNLSQLREIVLSRTLAETDAALNILREIHSMYRANGEAIVVVTPDDAGDFIRRQHAMLGVRLSKYLEVLFEHFSGMDTIPPDARLASVINAMESGVSDAVAVYAAGNAFDSTLILSGRSDLDRLPGHLPRTSPAENEYLGSALFSGPRMTGVLTGEETGLLCLMMGKAQKRETFIGNGQYKTNRKTHVRRSIGIEDGALCLTVRMNLTHMAGENAASGAEIAAQTETACAEVLRKLQACGCDAAGFGRLAAKKHADIGSWEASGWKDAYQRAPVKVRVSVRVQENVL